MFKLLEIQTGLKDDGLTINFLHKCLEIECRNILKLTSHIILLAPTKLFAWFFHHKQSSFISKLNKNCRIEKQLYSLLVSSFKKFSKERDSFFSSIFTLREQSPLKFSSAFKKSENIFLIFKLHFHLLHSQKSKKIRSFLDNNIEREYKIWSSWLHS